MHGWMVQWSLEALKLNESVSIYLPVLRLSLAFLSCLAVAGMFSVFNSFFERRSVFFRRCIAPADTRNEIGNTGARATPSAPHAIWSTAALGTAGGSHTRRIEGPM